MADEKGGTSVITSDLRFFNLLLANRSLRVARKEITLK